MEIIEKELMKLTTIQTSAKARFFAKINTIDELAEMLQFIEDRSLKTVIICNGTNILFVQELYEDIVFLKLEVVLKKGDSSYVHN